MEKENVVCVCVCVCTMEYHIATKKNEIVSFAATCVDLEINILSEASQTKKHKYHIVLLISESLKKNVVQVLSHVLLCDFMAHLF